jgi:hypothetical protein
MLMLRLTLVLRDMPFVGKRMRVKVKAKAKVKAKTKMAVGLRRSREGAARAT